MSDDSVSRRAALLALGAGVAGAAALEAAPAGAALAGAEPATAGGDADVTRALIAPLEAGSALGRWQLERIVPLEHGVASVIVKDQSGDRFQLDICARDTSAGARRAPGESEHFQVFLANRGDGAKATFEDHGLAAMALSEVIRGNEAQLSRAGFVTLAERLAAESARVHVD
jgi:hypothetical protein